ncbi:MAG: hypothetical protein ACOYL3_05480 [Desulfuromonadaceae bacterium]
MSNSPLMQQIRDERREEEKKLTPGERILLACELSDACVLLNQSARKALEKKRANTET